MARSTSPSSAGDWLAGQGSWFTATLMPTVLLFGSPLFVLLLYVITVDFDGSVLAACAAPLELLAGLPRPSLTAAGMLLVWLTFQAALLILLPGELRDGPVSPAGNRPRYKLNGVAAFIVTHLVWWLASGPLGLFDASVVYDHFGELLVTSSLLALVLCLVLYVQGLRMPKSSDAGGTGRPVWDFYWGTQLHPRIAGVELKQLINCRYAMMGWSIMVLSDAAGQINLHGQLSNAMLVCVGLQVVYVFKFFVWEDGYFHSIDIMHDRFGFYIAWGVCGWLPSVYTLPSLYLVDHPIAMNWAFAVGLFIVGLSALVINYQADAQRQRVRATGGQTTIWGRAPKTILATYTPADGVPRQNLLLVSGWWGVARPFHYLPELGLAFAWTLPVGFDRGMPWFYVIFLTILLVHRSLRDDDRCARKYGSAWTEYRQRVPWRMLPGVF